MDIWNIRYAPCPPTITELYDREKLEKICCLTSVKTNSSENSIPENWVSVLKRLLSKACNKISAADGTLLLEIKCLFSYIYQGGSVHKKEKFLHAAKKVAKCLKRWRDINLTKLLRKIGDMVPEEFFNIQKIRLPSPKLMYFLLHRLIGAFYLLLKTVEYCLEASVYMKAKLVQGHSLGMTILGYAMVARIRALVVDMCNSIAEASDDLHPYIMSMAEDEETLLTESLPNNLREELYQFSKKSEDKTSSIEEDFSSSNITDKNVKEATSTDDFGPDTDGLKDNEDVSGDFVYDVIGDGDADLGEMITHEKFESLKKLSHSVIETTESRKTQTQRNQFLNPASSCHPKLKVITMKKREQKLKKKTSVEIPSLGAGINDWERKMTPEKKKKMKALNINVEVTPDDKKGNELDKSSLSYMERKMTKKIKNKLKNKNKKIEVAYNIKNENEWDKSSLSNSEIKMTKKKNKKLKNINKNTETILPNEVETVWNDSLLFNSEKKIKKKKKMNNINKNMEKKEEEKFSNNDPELTGFKLNKNKRKNEWNREDSIKKIKRKK